MSEVRTDSIVNQSGDNDSGIDLSTNDVVAIKTANTEAMRIDSSGNLLVGKTSSDSGATAGVELKSDGNVRITKDGGSAIAFNRLTSNGTIVTFQKDGTTVGTINTDTTFGTFQIQGNATSGLYFGTNFMLPIGNTNSILDNTVDLGNAGVRFDNIYATNGNIQTSDANEKQQIASLTDAEITAAKAISALFKTFKWNDMVAEKGEAARTHAGVIAQDVEAAMTAAGLDAGDYGFFISSTWHVDADGNEVEADADGAIEKNRKGIRYPELLAFIGAATEQRLIDIEARITALETQHNGR